MNYDTTEKPIWLIWIKAEDGSCDKIYVEAVDYTTAEDKAWEILGGNYHVESVRPAFRTELGFRG